MSQPSVSVAIKELETFYHTILFDRMNRGIYITQSGETLLGYADNVLSSLQESVILLRDNNNFTKCRLGINMAVAESFLSELTNTLNRTVPNLQLYLFIGNSVDVESKLHSGQLDFAIVDSVADKTSTASVFLYQEPMSVLCANCFKTKDFISIEELSSQPVLLREKQSGSRQCVDAVFLKHGYAVTPTVESNSTLSLIAIAKKQFGYVFLPRSLALNECQNGILGEVAVYDDEFLRSFFIVYNRQKHLTTTMKVLRNCIINFFRN